MTIGNEVWQINTYCVLIDKLIPFYNLYPQTQLKWPQHNTFYHSHTCRSVNLTVADMFDTSLEPPIILYFSIVLLLKVIFPLQRAFCAFCQDRIWGLGRQGFKCIQCKLLVHKKCHKLVQKPCSSEHVDPVEIKDDANGESTLGRASSVR